MEFQLDEASSVRDARSPFPWRTTASICALCLIPWFVLQRYRRDFGLGSDVALFGQLLVLTGCATVGLVTLTVAAVGRGCVMRRCIWTLAVGTAALMLAISLVYTGAYLSNAMWGDTLTYRIAATFVMHPAAAVTFLPLEASRSSTVLAAIGAGVLVWSTVLLLVSRVLAGHVVRAFCRWCANAPRTRLVRLGLALSGLAVSSVAGSAWIRANNPAAVRGEPVAAFFQLVPSTSVADLDAVRLAAAVEDRHSRDTYPVAPVFRRKHVILIVSDALRADRMGIYGYQRPTTPFLSSLFAAGRLHRVEMALSTCSESYCGIASILASRPFHEVSSHNHKLHSLLRRVGYRVTFFLTGDHRAWNYLSEFYGPDVDAMYDYSTLGPAALTDDEPGFAALSAMPSDQGTPQFLYFFLMSSHMAGTKLPAYDRYRPAALDTARLFEFWNELAGTQRIDGRITAATIVNADVLARISNRYDNGVLQTDGAIERLFGLLRAKGYLQDALVVILGDHGEGLGEHGHIGHTRYLYQEDIRVPLLIYDTEGVTYRNRSFATHIDVAPTILKRLGLPVPGGWRGQSLLEPPGARVTIHQTRRGSHPCFAAVERTDTSLLKFVRCGGGTASVREELFDLRADPGERQDLALVNRPALNRLQSEIDRRFAVVLNRCRRFECVE